jgi:hypothetical protein
MNEYESPGPDAADQYSEFSDRDVSSQGKFYKKLREYDENGEYVPDDGYADGVRPWDNAEPPTGYLQEMIRRGKAIVNGSDLENNLPDLMMLIQHGSDERMVPNDPQFREFMKGCVRTGPTPAYESNNSFSDRHAVFRALLEKFPSIKYVGGRGIKVQVAVRSVFNVSNLGM